MAYATVFFRLSSFPVGPFAHRADIGGLVETGEPLVVAGVALILNPLHHLLWHRTTSLLSRR